MYVGKNTLRGGNVLAEGECAERSESFSTESPTKWVSVDYRISYCSPSGKTVSFGSSR